MTDIDNPFDKADFGSNENKGPTFSKGAFPSQSGLGPRSGGGGGGKSGGGGGGGGRGIKAPLADVTNIGTDGNKRLVPVDPGLLPASKLRYSDWILDEFSKHLLAENPDHGIKNWRQNQEIYWGTFADWAAKNPVQLKQTLYMFMADENNWIFQFFPIKIGQAATYIQEILSVNQELSHIGTRKVPFRNISASVVSKQKHAIYTAQGFSMDYHFMITPDGMIAWNRMVDALTANLWSFVIYQSMNELLFTPSFYRRENKLYPYNDIPRDVDRLFDYEQNNLFIINKQPQAFHALIKQSERVFEQAQIKPHGLILPRSLLWYSHARDPTNIYYDKSGPISLRERSTHGEQKKVDGWTMYPIPLVNGKLHDGMFTSLLDFQISLGSFTRHRELTINMSPAEYSSKKRSIRFCSSTLNQMKEYTLLEALSHAPEFYPIDYRKTNADDINNDDERNHGAYTDYDNDVIYHNDGSHRMFDNPSNPAGQINRDLLWALIKNREEVFHDRLRTRLLNNEDYLNTLIRHFKEPDTQKDQFYPIDMFGEIADCNARTKYLMHVYRTMEARLFEDIGPEGMTKFERGINLAKELNSASSADAEETKGVFVGQLKATVKETHSGMPFYEPNIYGGPEFKNTEVLVRELNNALGDRVVKRPYGMGSMGGFLTVVDLATKNANIFNENDTKIISECVDVLSILVEKLIKLCPGNPCLSPRLIPMFNVNQHMTEFTKIMHVAWNTLFSNMVTPNVVEYDEKNYLVQFTFEKSSKNIFAALLDFNDKTKKYVLNQKYGFEDVTAVNPLLDNFNASDDKMFGGSLFTALPFVDNALPFLERSGDIKDSLTKRQDVSVFPSFRSNRTVPYRCLNIDPSELEKILTANEKKEYTEENYNALADTPFLKDFPASITHMIANPLVKNGHKTVTDFEARIIASFTSYSKTLGLAARAVLYSRINLQTLTAWFDNNIAIPFGAMCIRPFETQVCTSAIAVAEGPLGLTYFSGLDNHVSFDTSLQHYNVQAFCQCAPVVENDKKFLVLPAVQGGAFLGGKGHNFVNQNSHMLIQDMENVKKAIETNNGVELGEYSIIATLTSYNSAVEKQQYHHMDLRNNYRRENFVGRLQNSERDFVDERPSLTYCAAPILNTLFNWNHPVTNEMMSDLSFAQYMYQRSHNYHIHETLYQEFDVVKGCGWVNTKSYHPWGETEQDNCDNIQSSHASIVKAF